VYDWVRTMSGCFRTVLPLRLSRSVPLINSAFLYILGGDRAVGYEVVFNVEDEVPYVGVTNVTLD